MKQQLQNIKAWVEENPKSVAIGVAIALPTGLALVGGYIITTALVYALLTVAAFGILIWKMRTAKNQLVRRTYGFLHKHPLATDIGFTIVAFALSPGGVIGMLGASVAAILVSAIITVMPGPIMEKIIEEPTEKVAQPV